VKEVLFLVLMMSWPFWTLVSIKGKILSSVLTTTDSVSPKVTKTLAEPRSTMDVNPLTGRFSLMTFPEPWICPPGFMAIVPIEQAMALNPRMIKMPKILLYMVRSPEFMI
jgi:hypothetical protein